jgi:hypothetical protein
MVLLKVADFISIRKICFYHENWRFWKILAGSVGPGAAATSRAERTIYNILDIVLFLEGGF